MNTKTLSLNFPELPDGAKVVVAHESDTYREIFRTKLTAAGYRVTCVADAEGLTNLLLLMFENKIGADEFDLLIISENMPTAINLELFEKLHRTGKDAAALRRLKVLFVAEQVSR